MSEQAYDLDKSFLDFQRMASDATKPKLPQQARPEISELERRRLVAEGWSTESIECYEKFGHLEALLYPLITKDGRNFGSISTPLGQGSLVSVLGGTCRVLLTRQRRATKQASGREYQPTEDFPTSYVKPYRNVAARKQVR